MNNPGKIWRRGLSRRRFLAATGAVTCASVAGVRHTFAASNPVEMVAAPTELTLLGEDKPKTAVWAYNGEVPGPVLRLRVGERLALRLRNELPQPSTLHWHGLRVPNAMDGVPHLTQTPVAPGGDFDYSFVVRNSGTFWYHPHFQTAEQLDRGLHGAVIVEDDVPPAVDRDLVWVVDDWRLGKRAAVVDDFGHRHDASHQGRFGNTATLNGRVPPDLSVRAGERIRLRIVNVANAWIFAFVFNGHTPSVIAYDGHAVEPHAPVNGRVTVGPAQRVDLIIDMTGKPGERFEVTDNFYPDRAYKFLDLVYDESASSKATARDVIALPEPVLPMPDVANAERHEIRFSGGAMGGMSGALYSGEQTAMRTLAQMGKFWAINGVVAGAHDEPSLLQLRLGRSYLFDFVNDTAFPHPVHLHGHPMLVLAVNDKPLPRKMWRDTLLLMPRARATVAMVADNPGRWMFHCHIPEHQDAGMMAVVDVA